MAIAEIPGVIEEEDTGINNDPKIEIKNDHRTNLQKVAFAAAKEVKEMHSFGGEQSSANNILELLQMCIEADSETERIVSKAMETAHISAPDEKLDYLDQIDCLKEQVFDFNKDPNLYRTQYDEKLTKLFEFCKTLSYLLSVDENNINE